MKSFFERLKKRALAAKDARTSTGGRSVEQLTALVNERPGDWATENELADALGRAGRLDEAVAQLCMTADRLAEEGWVAKAHGLYKKALRLRPQNEHAALRVSELNTARISSKPGAWTAPGVSVDAVAGEVAAPVVQPAAPPVEEAQSESGYSSPDAERVGASMSSEAVAPAEHAAAETHETAAEMPLSHQDTPVEIEQPAPASKTLEEVLQEAETAAGYGAVNTAVKMLIDCVRTHPERLEPVAALIEIAARAGLDEALADAQARLCDLQCRAGDYESARATAQALVARFPEDSRHRARLDFILGEIGESAESVAESSVIAGAAEPITELAAAVVESTDTGNDATIETETEIEIALEFTDDPATDSDALVDNEFQRALDALLAWDGSSDAAGVLAEARAGLERAANVPRHRMAAARQLAQLDSDAGDWTSALVWLECAAEAMVSSNQEEELAYEMAVVLERAGDTERARGVLSEIVAKVGPDYRDVSARLERLSSAVGAF
jgi:tetratricopeptide (TPR) repeat protein